MQVRKLLYKLSDYHLVKRTLFRAVSYPCEKKKKGSKYFGYSELFLCGLTQTDLRTLRWNANIPIPFVVYVKTKSGWRPQIFYVNLAGTKPQFLQLSYCSLVFSVPFPSCPLNITVILM